MSSLISLLVLCPFHTYIRWSEVILVFQTDRALVLVLVGNVIVSYVC